jgi:hypothetical protein
MSKNRDDKLVDEHYGRSDLAAKILERCAQPEKTRTPSHWKTWPQ